jgi:hypothetical protein
LVRQFLLFPIIMGLLLFLPAGTLDYWEGWVSVAVLFLCSVAITTWLMIEDPALLDRRLRAGPMPSFVIRCTPQRSC